MIRINLLRKSSGRRKQQHRPFPVKSVAITVVLLCALGGGGAGVWHYLHGRKPVEKIKTVVTDSTFVPTSHTSRTLVEDVVRDVQDTQLVLRESGLLALPYADLSFEEKVNYEFLFARNVFEMLGRSVPRQVGLETLTLDSFMNVRAYGVCASREIVTNVFTDLRHEKATILPRPFSTISASTQGGFVFRVEMTTNFGLNLKDPMVDPSLSSLPERRAAAEEVVRLQVLLESHKLTLVRPLAMISGEKLEKYRRLRYKLEASGSYENFVRAIGSMYDQRLPYAFEKLQVVAGSGRVVIHGTLILTTRE